MSYVKAVHHAKTANLLKRQESPSNSAECLNALFRGLFESANEQNDYLFGSVQSKQCHCRDFVHSATKVNETRGQLRRQCGGTA